MSDVSMYLGAPPPAAPPPPPPIGGFMPVHHSHFIDHPPAPGLDYSGNPVAPTAPGGGPSTPGAPPAAPPTDPTGRGQLSPAQQSAWDSLRLTFHQYGLDTPEVLDWARDQLINNTTVDSITLDLYDPTTVPGKVVNQLFPELALRRADPTSTPWSIDTAQQYRTTLDQIAAQTSLTPGFLDNEMKVKLAVGNVAPTEVKDRIGLAAQYAGLAPAESRSQFDALYGTGLGDHASFWLDPSRTESLLQRQFAAAQLSGSALRAGYGGLSQGQAERLAGLGVAPDAAQQTFGQLGAASELFGALPGSGEAGIGRDTQLAAAFENNTAANQDIARRRAARLAVFGGQAGYGATQAGVTGLGTAATG